MSDDPRSELIEAAATAFRERDVSGRIQPAPAWWDLSPQDREALFDLQMESRLLERALDRDGISATARAVLARIVS
jgi:hypothetical protein